MKIGIMLTVLLLATGGNFTFAETNTTGKKASSEFSKDEREKMAANHERMASCLRSDKPFQECRDEMREACYDQMGKDSCPMMGEMGGKRWMRKGAPKGN